MNELISIAEVEPGAIIVDEKTKYDNEVITWVVAHHEYGDGYFQEGSTILLSKNILTLKAFDSIELDKTKSASERMCGSNNYIHSNILHWLNTRGECRWERREDVGPYSRVVSCNEYDFELGFLSTFSDLMLNHMVESNIPINVLSKSNEKGKLLDVEETYIRNKVFLPSKTELGIPRSKGEGKHFKSGIIPVKNNLLLATPTEKACKRSKFKRDALSPDKQWYYWTRSATTKTTEDVALTEVEVVSPTGDIVPIFSCIGSVGVRPAIAVDMNLLVEQVDYGYYKVSYKRPDFLDKMSTPDNHKYMMDMVQDGLSKKIEAHIPEELIK